VAYTTSRSWRAESRGSLEQHPAIGECQRHEDSRPGLAASHRVEGRVWRGGAPIL